LEPRGAIFPALPEYVTKEDCLDALRTLEDDLLSEIPFVDEISRSVAIVGLLTCIARASMMTAPMHAWTAPEAGTGKSYIADMLVLLATGSVSAAITPGKDAEELEKRLDGLLMRGITNIVIANVYNSIECARLSELLSQEMVTCRMLGGNDVKHMRQIMNYAFVQAHGNQLQIEGELGRRTIYSEMDAKVDRPELRVFAKRPHEMIREDRVYYVNLVNIILRGKHQSEFAKQPVLNSYEDWCARIRDAVIWLGREDPVRSQEKIRGKDKKLGVREAVQAFWIEKYSNGVVTSAQVIKEAGTDEDILIKVRAGEYPKPEIPGDIFDMDKMSVHEEKWKKKGQEPSFYDLLKTICVTRGILDAGKLTAWLTENENRVCGGLAFTREGKVHSAVAWKCAPVGEAITRNLKEKRSDG
jgi:hypothetical protein